MNINLAVDDTICTVVCRSLPGYPLTFRLNSNDGQCQRSSSDSCERNLSTVEGVGNKDTGDAEDMLAGRGGRGQRQVEGADMRGVISGGYSMQPLASSSSSFTSGPAARKSGLGAGCPELPWQRYLAPKHSFCRFRGRFSQSLLLLPTAAERARTTQQRFFPSRFRRNGVFIYTCQIPQIASIL
ncbi:hypothetical protein K431DRAFT_80460 [Polychaeton citri CBS 116435]|uniref:Uncharacterized protein n=1 Tax=Polychaeton citri CBS 116435 TaxID=1314669 RepID=A0A9P4QGY6_9PEZI|nr:hypothetical protein K431DRAFT_80460 [Polychaeton citri CBS 116435]